MSEHSDPSNQICQKLRPGILHWFASKFPQDNELAEDLTQEVLLRLSKNLHHVEGDVKRYLSGIMLHVFSDYLRGSYREPATISLDRLAAALKDSDDKSPFDEEISEEVLEAIQNLPPKTRRIITLRYMQDLKIKDIVSLLGMKESTVKMQIKRGIKKLKEILSQSDLFL